MARTPSLILICVPILIGAAHALASTPVTELWRHLCFTTEGGDEVCIDAGKDSIRKIEIGLQGSRVYVPSNAMKGLGMPILKRTSLVRSFGVKGDRLTSSVALEFPIIDATKDSEEPDEMAIVSMVIVNGRIVRRDVWENQKKQHLRDRLEFTTAK